MTLKSPYAVLLALTAVINGASAQSATEKARLSRTMWSAFQCGTYADMSDNPTEQARLFAVGIKAGREFLDALIKREIPPEAANNEVPIGVSMLLSGPSTDFVLGRIFENAMRDAYDAVAKGSDGKWIFDKELQKSISQTKYLTANCVLLK